MNEPRLECFDCLAAASGAHDSFSADCPGCAARSLALFERERAERIDRYDPLWFDTLPVPRESLRTP